MIEKEPHKIDHIGIAVKSIEAVLPFYTGSLKLSLLSMEEVPTQGVKIATLAIGEAKIELLEPLTETSPLATYLKKYGEGIHHFALGVKNIDEKLVTLKEDGLQFINNQPLIGANQTKIAFLHPHSTYGVLYELVEAKEH